jgi:hypothetical protein
MFRNLDQATLHITQENGQYFVCSSCTPLARLSHSGATTASQCPSSPTAIAVESPIILVRETADEQDFVVLATLTAAK